MIFPDLWFDKDDEIFKDYVVLDGEGNKSNYLPKLSRINIFIGPNNSGKSRFHRNLFKTLFDLINSNVQTEEKEKSVVNSIASKTTDFSIYNISHCHHALNSITARIIRDIAKSSPDSDEKNTVENVIQEIEEYIQKLQSQVAGNFLVELYNLLSKLQLSIASFYVRLRRESAYVTALVSEFKERIIDEIKNIQSDILTSLETPIQANTYGLTYCPTLRTLKKLAGNNPIFDRFLSDYFSKYTRPSLANTVFTGEDIFFDLRRLLLGRIHDIKSVFDLSEFIGFTFYNGAEFSMAASDLDGKTENKETSDGILNVKIGNDPELRITQLGEGVQAIITLIFPLFTKSNKKHLLFIDEPEQNLHPGFQRIFMETLLQDRFKDTQVFLCTHSNHFLDMSLDYPDDISIYSFQKKRKENTDESYFEIKYRAGRDKDVLQMIGARNSSVFLSNCTLWVEGITDRLYIRAWLDIYQKMIQLKDPSIKKYYEDIHFSFIEFGGANITHWSFLDDEEGINVESLCGPVLVLADSDDTSKPNSAKTKRHETLKQRLDKNYVMVERREIENVLLPKQITASASKVFGNEQVLTLQFTFNDYDSSYLGTFLDERVGLKKGKGSVFASESGTIKNKVKFCRAVVNELKTKTVEANTVEELKNLILPDGIEENEERLDTPYHLAKRVYEFIAEHNS